MAVNAIFKADFSSFTDAVNKAQVSLQNVEADANKVAKSLNAMVDNFSGRKLINDALLMTKAVEDVGGASALTAKEMARVNATVTEAIDKYTALGKTAPTAMTDLATATQGASKGVDAVGKATTDLGTAAKTTTQPVSALSGWFTSLGTQLVTTAAGFVSAQAVIGLAQRAFSLFTDTISSSITAFADAELAQTKLVTALRTQGDATPEVISQYNKLASQFQDTTVFSDDLINSMQGLLVQVGDVMPSQMDAALRASTDLAAGLGIDLQTATELVAKAAAGHTETLGRYGVKVSEAALKSEGFSAVLDAVNKQFGGQAAAQVETYAGQLRQAANAWNNLQEAIGKFIVQNPLVVAGIRAINEALKEGEKKTDDSAFSLTKFIGLWLSPENAQALEAAAAWAEAQNAIATAWERLANIPSPFKKLGDDLANFKFPDPGGLAFFDQMNEAEKETAKQTKIAREALDKFNATLDDVTTAGRAFSDVIDEIDGNVVEGTRYYLARGVAVGDLATIYHITKAQVDAIKSSMEDENNILDQATDAFDRNRAMTLDATKAIETGMLPQLTELKVRLGIVTLTSQGFVGQMALIPGYSREAATNMATLTEKADHLGVIFGKLPGLFIDAFTGGGNLKGAINAFGTTITTELFGPTGALSGITEKVAGLFGKDGIGGAIGKSLSGFLPIIGGLVGPAIEGLGKLFGKVFGSAEKAVNKTRDAFVNAAGGLDALRDKATEAGVSINALLNAKTAEQYKKAIDDLNLAFDEHAKDIETAKGLIEEYGLTIDQLGPKWKAQQLTEQVGTLMDQLRVMVDVLGLSAPDALTVMRDKFQAAFDTAKTFGIELPKEMQPVLQQMIDLGLLTDESGNKYTDLQDTGVTFAKSLGDVVDVMDRLIKKFDEFLQRLGLVPANLRTDVDVYHHDHYDSSQQESGGATGGFVTASGIQAFSGGGRVLPFRRPPGTDTVRAWLTPGEGVLSVPEMHALGGVSGFNALRASLKGGGGSSLDTSDLKAELQGLRAELMADRLNGPQKIARAVASALQNARVGRR